MRKFVRAAMVGVAATTFALVSSAQAFADTVGFWSLDEPSGSSMAADASGNALHGDVGSDVVTGEVTPTGYGYRFRGDWRIVNDERLVTWQDDDRLDPGTQPFAVTLRVKTGALDPNMMQKGQNNQAGGYWKFVLKKGWPRCHFEDGSGRILAIGFVKDVRPETKVADNTWHTLRCEKTATGVKATIDYGEPGAVSKFKRGTLGAVNNAQPMFLGGKLFCDGGEVTCDYFAGAIDWVRIER